MSYILEALKKAQAERQLGNAPTIHAPMPSYAAPAPASRRTPLMIGLALGAIVAALGAVFVLRQPAPAPVQVTSVPAPAAVAAPVVAQPAPAQALAPAIPAEPVKPKNPPARAKQAPPPRVAEAAPRAEPAEPVLPVLEAPRPAPVVATPPAAAPSPEENVGTLQSLPEAVQRDVPKVAFGGYIYSPNPAERLLLVDKTLRREGEEVAPGLVLERLLPKAAIMNFRGYRYRVGY